MAIAKIVSISLLVFGLGYTGVAESFTINTEQETEQPQEEVAWPYNEGFFQEIADYIINKAPEINQDQIAVIIEQTPEALLFVPVSDEFLQSYWPTDTRISAVYDANDLVVYYNQDIDQNTDYFKSIILHELLHHIQYQLGDHETAMCAGELERAAYELQADYLKDLGYGSSDSFYTFVRYSSILSGRCGRQF